MAQEERPSITPGLSIAILEAAKPTRERKSMIDDTLLPRDYVTSLFNDHPLANNLLDEVAGFYRDSLVIRREKNANDMSGYKLDVDAKNLKFNGAIINIDTSTNRVPAAACHELLHLRLPTRNFPRIRSLSLTPIHQSVVDFVVQAQTSVTNVVDHDIFKDDFIALGFPIEQFLVKSNEIISYKRVARDARNQTTPSQLKFTIWSWWCIEYLRHYITSFHGQEDCKIIAEKIAKWGVKALPGFGRGMARIREWVSDGKHRQPTQYAAAMRTLFDIIQIPPISGFYAVQLDGDNQVVLHEVQ
jgi:hypothetical protein